MKKLSYVLVIVLALSALLISACGGSSAISAPDSTSVGGSKPLASLVEFTGVIQSIAGNEWTVDGQKITVDPVVVRDGPFNVGDTVKVEVQVQADGSMVVNRVEAPSAVDNSNDANSNANVNVNGNDNSNANSNDNSNVNSNDSNSNDDNSNVNSNDSNSNDDNSNINSNDDNSNDDKSNDDNSGGDDSDGGGNTNDD